MIENRFTIIKAYSELWTLKLLIQNAMKVDTKNNIKFTEIGVMYPRRNEKNVIEHAQYTLLSFKK